MPRKPGLTTDEFNKAIQRLTGTPGNQSPRVKQIFETPTEQDPHPEQEVPEGTKVLERHVLKEGGGDANTSTEGQKTSGTKATDSNDTQRARSGGRG